MRIARAAAVAILFAGVQKGGGAAADQPGVAEIQAREYNAEKSKSILELQQFRRTTSIQIAAGAAQGTATLANLNPAVNSWYLLTLTWQNGAPQADYHLDNAKPKEFKISLDQKTPNGVWVESGKDRHFCDLLSGSPNALDKGRSADQIYYPLCEGRFYLRNPAKGSRTAIEAATEFVRDQVWGGEKVIVMVHHLLADKERESAQFVDGGKGAAAYSKVYPGGAAVDPKFANRMISQGNLGISLDYKGTGVTPGAWYPVLGNPGIFVSVIQPSLLPAWIMGSYKNYVTAWTTWKRTRCATWWRTIWNGSI